MNDLEQLIISQMRDIKTIHSVPSLPIGPGWWVVAIAGMIILAVNFYFSYQRYKYRQSWKFALEKELGNLGKTFKKASPKQAVSYLNEILKRVSMYYYGRKETASLEGMNWLEWLSARDPNGFDWMDKGLILIDYPYMPEDRIKIKKREIIQIVKAIKGWLR